MMKMLKRVMMIKKKKREVVSKFLPQGRQDPRDFKPDSAKPLFHDDDDHNDEDGGGDDYATASEVFFLGGGSSWLISITLRHKSYFSLSVQAIRGQEQEKRNFLFLKSCPPPIPALTSPLELWSLWLRLASSTVGHCLLTPHPLSSSSENLQTEQQNLTSTKNVNKLWFSCVPACSLSSLICFLEIQKSNKCMTTATTKKAHYGKIQDAKRYSLFGSNCPQSNGQNPFSFCIIGDYDHR